MATELELEGSGPYALTTWAFENAWNVAQAKSDTSDALFQQALTAGGSAPTMTPAALAFSPSVVEPLVNIPQQAEGASLAKFHELSGAVIDQLAGLFSGYIERYFPNETPYLTKAQDWLVKALTTGGTGINAHVEDQIWQRDRARVLKDAARAEEEVITAWAGRGYPLPPGAAAYQVLQVRQDAQDKIAQASRDVAIKQAELEVENVKFAVQQSIDLYTKAMSAAADYIKALSIGPNSAMQVVPSVTDSQSRLISAAADYYRARISVDELRLRAQQPNAEFAQRAREKNAELIMEEIKTRVSAAISAAQSLGTQAASALNSLHASASVSGSGSTSVGYSYSGEVTSDVPPKTA